MQRVGASYENARSPMEDSTTGRRRSDCQQAESLRAGTFGIPETIVLSHIESKYPNKRTAMLQTYNYSYGPCMVVTKRGKGKKKKKEEDVLSNCIIW